MNSQILSRYATGLIALAISISTHGAPYPAQEAFFNRLAAMCGAVFTGSSTFPDDPGEDWKDKKLQARIANCEPGELRIPFSVGEDRSRTWILRRTGEGLELKHDHRHEDGSPHEITAYGGLTQSSGTEYQQSFPADSHTADLIPEAKTNEWLLSIDETGTELIYYLERHGKPRFKAVLRRTE